MEQTAIEINVEKNEVVSNPAMLFGSGIKGG